MPFWELVPDCVSPGNSPGQEDGRVGVLYFPLWEFSTLTRSDLTLTVPLVLPELGREIFTRPRSIRLSLYFHRLDLL